MRRLVWLGIGATAGILVYRRAQQAIADVREQGVLVSAQHAGQAAASAAGTVRSLATGAVHSIQARSDSPGNAGAPATYPRVAPGTPGAAAAQVLGEVIGKEQ